MSKQRGIIQGEDLFRLFVSLSTYGRGQSFTKQVTFSYESASGEPQTVTGVISRIKGISCNLWEVALESPDQKEVAVAVYNPYDTLIKGYVTVD